MDCRRCERWVRVVLLMETNAGIRLRVVGPVLAECPEDGGKWVLYCEHFVDGEWVNGGLIQDTNKRRLAGWKVERFNDGHTQWCPLCQELTTDPDSWRNRCKRAASQ